MRRRSSSSRSSRTVCAASCRTPGSASRPVTWSRTTSGTPADLADADAVVLLVDHDDFDRDAIVEHSRYVLDTRAWLPPGPNVERL